MKIFKRNKDYIVSVEYKESTILQQDFSSFDKACKWTCKTLRAFLVCNVKATILDNATGEIMLILGR